MLDLTRVIAGPVATRYLGALGADVLRLDPPDRPELTMQTYDGLLGKRSALLDFGTADGMTGCTSCSPAPTSWCTGTGRTRWTGSGWARRPWPSGIPAWWW